MHDVLYLYNDKLPKQVSVIIVFLLIFRRDVYDDDWVQHLIFFLETKYTHTYTGKRAYALTSFGTSTSLRVRDRVSLGLCGHLQSFGRFRPDCVDEDHRKEAKKVQQRPGSVEHVKQKRKSVLSEQRLR